MPHDRVNDCRLNNLNGNEPGLVSYYTALSGFSQGQYWNSITSSAVSLSAVGF
jgi:hypothetical protein